MMLAPLVYLLFLAQNAYVNTNGGVAVIDTATGAVAATLPLSAGNAAVAPNGGSVYITQTASKTVAVVNTTSNQIVASILAGNGVTGVAVSPDSSKVYATNLLDGTVSAINASTNQVVATIPVGQRPFGLAVSMDGAKVYVANSGGNSVSVIATASNTVSSIIVLPFTATPMVPAFSLDGTKAYVTDDGNGRVYAIATATDTVTGTIQPGLHNQAVAFSPKGAQAYVTNQEGSVVVVNSATDAVVGTVTLGGTPAGVAFSADGTRAYVVNQALAEVQVIDTGTMTVTAAIPTPAQPTGFGVFIQPGGAAAVSAVVNGFTFLPGQSPGSLIAITGTNLASMVASFTGTSLPLAIGDTSVLLNGAAIRLFYVSPTQINAQMPVNIAVSISSLKVMNGAQASNPVSVTVDSASPGIPYYVLNGANHASARNGDNSVNGPANPAAVGSVITIYLTGIGPVTNPVAAGQEAPTSPLSNAMLPVTVTIDDKVVVPTFAGLSPGSIALAQVNVQVPALAAGDHQVVVTVGSFVSNAPLISIGN